MLVEGVLLYGLKKVHYRGFIHFIAFFFSVLEGLWTYGGFIEFYAGLIG